MYHSGFNSGFNVAEAVNFATPAWLREEVGLKAVKCTCRADHVSINFAEFVHSLLAQTRQTSFASLPFGASELEDLYERALDYYSELPKPEKKLKKRILQDEQKKARILYKLGANVNSVLWRECDICNKARRLQDTSLFVGKNF